LRQVETEVRANGVFAFLEEPLDERLVHDGHVLGRRGVSLRDGAAFHDLLAHGLEIADADMVPGRADLFLHTGHTVTLAYHDLTPVVLQRSIESECCALDAGDMG
jgi:hypothetical protein